MSKKVEMHICLGSSCFSRGNKDVVNYIKDYIRKNRLEDKFLFLGSRCMNHCSNGPNIRINEEVIEGLNLTTIESILDREVAKIK